MYESDPGTDLHPFSGKIPPIGVRYLKASTGCTLYSIPIWPFREPMRLFKNLQKLRSQPEFRKPFCSLEKEKKRLSDASNSLQIQAWTTHWFVPHGSARTSAKAFS